jgi:CBS domain containing-hemolysin-like protein
MEASEPGPGLIIAIVLSLIASAFFSGCEIAFVSANRLQIELANKQGKFSAKILAFFYQKSSQFIGTMLVGNNAALVLYGLLMGDLFTDMVPTSILSSEVLRLLLETILSTLIILVTAEFLPKAIFSNAPNYWLNFFAPILAMLYFILWLPAFLSVSISRLIISLFVKKDEDEGDLEQNFGRVDLDHYIKEVLNTSNGNNDLDTELTIFNNALGFSELKARDCMVPRNEIVAVDIDSNIESLRQKFIESKYSKILIYRDNIDNIIGYVHSFALFKKPDSISAMLLPVFIVPESMPTQFVLRKFTEKKNGMAIVVDEFGGTSGMLTIEDIIEELFGEIEDEHDQDDFVGKKVGTSEYIFSGRLEIDHINEEFKLNLPESEGYETLSGLIIGYLKEIPEKGDKLVIEGFEFNIDKMEAQRIDLVRIKVLSD